MSMRRSPDREIQYKINRLCDQSTKAPFVPGADSSQGNLLASANSKEGRDPAQRRSGKPASGLPFRGWFSSTHKRKSHSWSHQQCRLWFSRFPLLSSVPLFLNFNCAWQHLCVCDAFCSWWCLALLGVSLLLISPFYLSLFEQIRHCLLTVRLWIQGRSFLGVSSDSRLYDIFHLQK